jgi:hypothetical protein
MTYAANTSVSIENSRMEIERTLARYGAEEFIYGAKPDQAVIQFRYAKRIIRFNLPLKGWQSFKTSPKGRSRRDGPAQEAWEQDCRSRFRALALVLKAKLEAVESGITTFEEEFLAHVLLPNGQTVYEETRAKIATAYESGKVPMMLGFSENVVGS